MSLGVRVRRLQWLRHLIEAQPPFPISPLYLPYISRDLVEAQPRHVGTAHAHQHVALHDLATLVGGTALDELAHLDARAAQLQLLAWGKGWG